MGKVLIILFILFIFGLVCFFVRGVLLWALYTNNCLTAVASTYNVFRTQVVSFAGFQMKNSLKIRCLWSFTVSQKNVYSRKLWRWKIHEVLLCKANDCTEDIIQVGRFLFKSCRSFHRKYIEASQSFPPLGARKSCFPGNCILILIVYSLHF